MCGVFGYIGYRKNAPEIVFEGLKKLEYRGYDSWGVAAVVKSKLKVEKKSGKIGNNILHMSSGNVAIGHTRWATHGGVSKVNAHPHLDCKSKVAVIHNGIFENYEQYKNMLIKKGHSFASQTDTEVIPHLIEIFENKYSFSKSVRMVFNKIKGFNAVIAISTDSREIVAARNGSPLVVGFGNNENFLASDVSALTSFTNKVYFLGNDEVAIIKQDKVQIIDSNSGKIKKIKRQIVDANNFSDGKGKYPNFMIKEIYEQPKIISEIAASGIPFAIKNSQLIKSSRGTYIIGCGTAYFACLAGQYLFSKIANYHINPAIGSEFSYHLNFINNKSLIIPISQSGETMDILESVQNAKDKGAKISCLVNVPNSSLFRISDFTTIIGSGQENAVASTKALIGMISHLILTSYALINKIAEGKKILKAAKISVEKVLSDKSILIIKKIAKKIYHTQHIYIIGRGLSYPTALEAALKIKEISYIHAEGLAAGELKHGPLALIKNGSICVAFLPSDETYSANLSAAMEMKARGGFVIGVAEKKHEVFDYFIPVKDASEATIIPNIVVSQLLAYFLTIKKGLDPDKPRNLAKSVTVK